MSTFDSPIEQAMAAALAARPQGSYGLQFMSSFGMDYEACRSAATAALFETSSGGLAYPHVRIGPYEVDFLVLFRASKGETRCIAVECDGHDFHEKTKQQAAHDRRRDRYLALHSIVMLRFTGSEIWGDAGACAQEVHEAMMFMLGGPRSKVWLGYLNESEQEERQQKKYDAWVQAEGYRLAREDGLRREALAREMELEEGYFP